MVLGQLDSHVFFKNENLHLPQTTYINSVVVICLNLKGKSINLSDPVNIFINLE